MAPLTGRALVAAMCLGQVGNLLPHVVVPAIMAQYLMPLWNLSASQAGLMASAYAFGYMLAVPLLTALTDRIDARGILLAGSLLSGVATLAFGLFADGLVSASLWWGLAGVGFGGAYMPGLKALTDRLPPGETSRSVTLYTASFSIGVGLSFLVSQLVAARFGWRNAFFMIASAAVALAIGFGTTLPAPLLLMLLLIYGFTVPGDSGALTSGMSASAVAQQRGATMALHSTVGFGLSALGAWGGGVALDAAGGPASESGWLAAFALLAAGVLLGPVILWWSRRTAS